MTDNNLSPAKPGQSECAYLLRLPQVQARTALSRSEIYRRIAAGTFPAPVKLGERASAWPEHEIAAWCAARIAARDAKVAA